MLLKTEKISNKEKLITILESQLKAEKSELERLTEAHEKIQTIVAQLELLLQENPDCQDSVNNHFARFKPKVVSETVNYYAEPIQIKIEGDRLDNFTEILDSNTSGLDFKRVGDKVIVSVIGKEIHGVYGINSNEIWMEYRLHSYFKSLNIDFDEILDGTGEVLLITDSDTKQEAQAEYTPKESDAYDSLYGELPTPTPEAEDKIETYPEITPNPSQTSEVNEVSVSKNDVSFQQPEPTEQIFDELKSDSLKDRMLGCQNKLELDEFKAEVGPEKTLELWESCNIIEKNVIRCITKTQKKPPATLGYQFTYTNPITKIKYDAIYLGFYLYSQPLENGEKRAILVDNLPIICDKSDLKPIPIKKQRKLSETEVKNLESIITNPKPEKDTETPTPEEIANNTFTGLAAPAPKQQNSSQIGNKPDSELLKPSVPVQPELDLKPEPTPDSRS